MRELNSVFLLKILNYDVKWIEWILVMKNENEEGIFKNFHVAEVSTRFENRRRNILSDSI